MTPYTARVAAGSGLGVVSGIDIAATDSELLLFIPASQKERAKAIDGRRWDPDRKCWVYPKTGRVYDALVAEFGDDLVSLSIPRPGGSRQAVVVETPTSAQLAAENQGLRDEMAKVRDALEQLGAAALHGRLSEIQGLEGKLAARESEALELKLRLEQLDRELLQARHDAALAEAELSRLQVVNNALQADAARGQSEPTDARKEFTKTLKELAKYTSGDNQSFMKIIDKSKLSDESLPVMLYRELERELRQRLKAEDRAGLAELISQARDSDLLTQDGADLAHIIRKQRNKIIRNCSPCEGQGWA